MTNKIKFPKMFEIEKRILEIVILIVFLKHCYDFILYSIHVNP
jgi:hypothetical protein